MKKIACSLVLGTVLACAPPFVSATVLNFDDLTGTGVVPTSYGGLNFNGWLFSDVIDPAYKFKSASTTVFNDYVDINNPTVTEGTSITSAKPIVFDGAYFSGYSGATFNLYLGNSLVHTSAALPDVDDDSYGPTFLSSGYTGLVDKITVTGVQRYFVVDDLTYHVAAVPEPETYAMMFAGLAVIGCMARRRKSAL